MAEADRYNQGYEANDFLAEFGGSDEFSNAASSSSNEPLISFGSSHPDPIEVEPVSTTDENQFGKTSPIPAIDQNQQRDIIASNKNSGELFGEGAKDIAENSIGSSGYTRSRLITAQGQSSRPTRQQTQPIPTPSLTSLPANRFGSTTPYQPNAECADEDITDNGEPEITMTCSPYQRFRYESERPPPKKGPNQRMYMDDDKNTLAKLLFANFTGCVNLTAYCVTHCGDLHPFRLHGDRCVNGVYHERAMINSRDRIFKLSKVGITTPKAKEYAEVVALKKQQLQHLNAAGANKKDMCHNIKDKNTVYLQVEAVLQTSTGDKRVTIGPVIIHNRKAGSEFKIDSVEPAWAPATGRHPGNINERVLIVVTEETAFPNDIGVIIRERKDGQIVWQPELIKDTDIRVIRKTVIEFVPPPYANPKTPETVEVEICLYDIDNDHETEPVAFLYTSVIDEYGISNKAKKRKIDASLTKGYTRSSLTAQGQSNRLTATVHHGNVPRYTTGRQQMQSIPNPSLGLLPVLSGSEKPTTNPQRVATPSCMFSSVPAASSNLQACDTSTQYSLKQSFSAHSTGSEKPTTNPQRVATPSCMFSSVHAASSNLQACDTSAQYSLKQSSEKAETAQQLHVQDPVQPTPTPTSAVPGNQRQQDLPPPQPQAFGTQQQQLEGRKFRLEQQQQLVNKTSQLQLQVQKAAEVKHLLQPNQSFKIIHGQVVILNDDIHTTVAPTQELPSAPVLQNVGGQPVIVQSMQPQQPTSDTLQAEATYPASNQPYSCPASSLQPAAADIQGTTAAPPADIAQINATDDMGPELLEWILSKPASQQAMQTDPTAGLHIFSNHTNQHNQ